MTVNRFPPRPTLGAVLLPKGHDGQVQTAPQFCWVVGEAPADGGDGEVEGAAVEADAVSPDRMKREGPDSRRDGRSVA